MRANQPTRRADGQVDNRRSDGGYPLAHSPDYYDGDGQCPVCDPSTSAARRSHDNTMGRMSPPMMKWARFR